MKYWQVEREQQAPKFSGFGLLANLPFMQDAHWQPGDSQRHPRPETYNAPAGLLAEGGGQRVSLLHRATPELPFNLWAVECTTAVDDAAISWMTQGAKTLWLDTRGGYSRDGGSTMAETHTMRCPLGDHVKRKGFGVNEILVKNDEGDLVYLKDFQETMKGLAVELFGRGYRNVVGSCNQAANRTPFIMTAALMMMYNMYTPDAVHHLYCSLRRLRCLFDMTTPPPHGSHLSGLEALLRYGNVVRAAAASAAQKRGFTLPVASPSLERGTWWLPEGEWKERARASLRAFLASRSAPAVVAETAPVVAAETAPVVVAAPSKAAGTAAPVVAAATAPVVVAAPSTAAGTAAPVVPAAKPNSKKTGAVDLTGADAGEEWRKESLRLLLEKKRADRDRRMQISALEKKKETAPVSQAEVEAGPTARGNGDGRPNSILRDATAARPRSASRAKVSEAPPETKSFEVGGQGEGGPPSAAQPPRRPRRLQVEGTPQEVPLSGPASSSIPFVAASAVSSASAVGALVQVNVAADGGNFGEKGRFIVAMADVLNRWGLNPQGDMDGLRQSVIETLKRGRDTPADGGAADGQAEKRVHSLSEASSAGADAGGGRAPVLLLRGGGESGGPAEKPPAKKPAAEETAAEETPAAKTPAKRPAAKETSAETPAAEGPPPGGARSAAAAAVARSTAATAAATTAAQNQFRADIVGLCRRPSGHADWAGLAQFLEQRTGADAQEMLRQVVAVVPDPQNIAHNRDGHSICHILAARKPPVHLEDVATGALRRILQACSEMGELDHRNCRGHNIVHCAASQHNYVFLEALRWVAAALPADAVPWDAPAVDDNRSAWQRQFVAENPRGAGGVRTAVVLAAMTDRELPWYMTEEQGREQARGRRRRERSREKYRGGGDDRDRNYGDRDRNYGNHDRRRR